MVSASDDAFAERAGKLRGVVGTMPDFVVSGFEPASELLEFDEDLGGAGLPPNTGDDDVLLDFLWGHTAVDAFGAWDQGQRGAGVRVAILDSGIDADHPDLSPNLNTALSRSFVPGEDWDIQPATPHVARIAALIIGAHGGDMSPSQVAATLRATADDLGKRGIDPYFGHGRVNAARAVR